MCTKELFYISVYELLSMNALCVHPIYVPVHLGRYKQTLGEGILNGRRRKAARRHTKPGLRKTAAHRPGSLVT